MHCLFCNGKEKNYQPGPDVDFICSLCVIMLADVEQHDLKRAYARAVKKGYQAKAKAKAIESFLIPETRDEQRKPAKKRGRHTHRERINRAIGNQKERIRRL